MEHLLTLLNKEFPHPKPTLKFRSVFELLVAVILSAQCTDERVNRVTTLLFPKTRPLEPKDILEMGKENLKKAIFSTGYFNSKTTSIYGSAELIEKSGKGVPSNFKELTALPGVGPKTAQVIESQWFKIPAFPVDTHVHRVANRLGLANSGLVREKTEKQLKIIVPKESWNRLHLQLIAHGRKTCTARNPKCSACSLFKLCAWPQKNLFLGTTFPPAKVITKTKSNNKQRPSKNN